MNNENKKRSRYTKPKIERKIKKDDKLKTLLNKIKTEKKKKNKNVNKTKELEIELVEDEYAKNPNKLQSELKKLNNIHVVKKIYMKLNKSFNGLYWWK